MCACGSLTNQFACSSNVRTYQASLHGSTSLHSGKTASLFENRTLFRSFAFFAFPPPTPLGLALAPTNGPSDITDVISPRTMPMSHPLGEMCPMEQRTGLVDTTGQCTAYRYNKIPVTGAHNKPPCQLDSLDRIMGENPLFGAAGRVNDAL